MMGWGMGWFGMIFMFVFWILLIVGLVFLIKWLIHSTRSSKDGVIGSSRPLEILKERYARGELSKEEFDRMKQDLLS
ncbi:MAG: SHOCT domain-containing protein [Deltaproteobacteria bacterium]|nr:SHOCT domain-containing protein [Deltaproteobacteria bacterium]MBW2072154.1 SHOCT domain-containing protein [Deltaproteobacteria bacterium]